MSVRFVFEDQHWVRGTARFPSQMTAMASAKFLTALEATYRVSQDIVHVVSGSLKHSGRKEISYEGTEIGAGLAYGGPSSPHDVDYAQLEYQRGGSHDFLTPAFAQTDRLFPVAAASAFEDVMITWR